LQDAFHHGSGTTSDCILDFDLFADMQSKKTVLVQSRTWAQPKIRIKTPRMIASRCMKNTAGCEELELRGLNRTVQRARLIDKGRRVSPALIRAAKEFFDSLLAIPLAADRIDAESIDR
jgi:hypothetical protein